VAASAVLSFLSAVAFAAPPSPRHEPKPPKPPRAGRLPALAGGGIRTVVATSAAFGLTFGALDVALPAFARTHGSAATAGVLLVGVRSRKLGRWAPLRTQDPPESGRRALPRSVPARCGRLRAPDPSPEPSGDGHPRSAQRAVLRANHDLSARSHQRGGATGTQGRGVLWLGTLYGTGLALGAALSGQLITAGGTRAALAAACGATALAWLFTTVRASSLSPPGPTTDSATSASSDHEVDDRHQDEVATPG
jgi:hypothetical protein